MEPAVTLKTIGSQGARSRRGLPIRRRSHTHAHQPLDVGIGVSVSVRGASGRAAWRAVAARGERPGVPDRTDTWRLFGHSLDRLALCSWRLDSLRSSSLELSLAPCTVSGHSTRRLASTSRVSLTPHTSGFPIAGYRYRLAHCSSMTAARATAR